MSKEDAVVVKAMAVLRNILVHGYAAVEPEKVVECSKRVGQDALRIAEAIISALEGRGIDPFEDEAVAKIRDVLRGKGEVGPPLRGEGQGVQPQGGLRRRSVRGGR
ncbi:MAG: HepT-like ribonuclease domain-containing protein, partial [Pyrobaculum sp.]